MEDRINRRRENLIAGLALEAAFLMRSRRANSHQGQSPTRGSPTGRIYARTPIHVAPCSPGESIYAVC